MFTQWIGTKLLSSSLHRQKGYTAMKCKYWVQYIGPHIGTVRDWLIAEIQRDYCEAALFGSDLYTERISSAAADQHNTVTE